MWQKNWYITATLTPRNSGSVTVNLPMSSIKNLFRSKVMLCVWCNFEGMIRWEFVLNGRAVDSELHSQQLERVHEILRRRYPALVNWNRVLQQDNAKPHTARTTLTKIQELGGIELLPYSANNSGFASPDYHLFRSMARFFHGRNFENIEAVEVGLTKFFASKAETSTVAG